MIEVYKVGLYIECEFVTFATCTTLQKAKNAKKLLEKAGWNDSCTYCEYQDECKNNQEYEDESLATPHCGIVIIKSNLYLDSITIDGISYDLTESEE